MPSKNHTRLLTNDLQRHTQPLLSEIKQAIHRVLDQGQFILGTEVVSFEQTFASYCGTSQCISVASGTDALELALRGLGVGSGDQVITVSNAGVFSRTAIRALGAEPLYVDVDAETMTLDATRLNRQILEKSRAIIVTHLYGQIADMPAILTAAEKFNVPVIEDCAQSHGAQMDTKRAGKWGRIGCFSFYPTKNLGALGDGGAVVTDDEALAERIRYLRNYGLKGGQVQCEGGKNSRMDELQAAILRVKLPHLDRWNHRRREIAFVYTEAFSKKGISCPRSVGTDYVAHLYVLRVPQRDKLRQFLEERGICTQVHYPVADHLQPAIQNFSFSKVHLPITEECCQTVISLPCFPEMTDVEVQYVTASVTEAVSAINTDG